MGECFITRRGGTKAFAYIGVTYPEGSTLICSNGSKTLSAKTTNGTWTFEVPCAGTWTVTVTDGTYSKSAEVSITAQYQCATVNLKYELVLFDCTVSPLPVAGVDYTCEYNYSFEIGTSGMTIYGRNTENGGATSRKVSRGESFDVTDYTALKFEVTRNDSSTKFELMQNGSAAAAATAANSAIGVQTLDISSCTGAATFRITSPSGNDKAVVITKIWLE